MLFFSGGVELSSRDTCLRADTVYRVSISVPRSEPPGGSILLDSVSSDECVFT